MKVNCIDILTKESTVSWLFEVEGVDLKAKEPLATHTFETVRGRQEHVRTISFKNTRNEKIVYEISVSKSHLLDVCPNRLAFAAGEEKEIHLVLSGYIASRSVKTEEVTLYFTESGGKSAG